MLNSSHRAETNCYYLPSLSKFYEGRVQSHVAFPFMSHGLDTLQPFGCCTPTRTTQGELCSPEGMVLPHQKDSLVPRPSAPQFSLQIAAVELPAPATSLPTKDGQCWSPASAETQGDPSVEGSCTFGPPTQALGAEAPQPEPELELLLTVTWCAHKHV